MRFKSWIFAMALIVIAACEYEGWFYDEPEKLDELLGDWQRRAAFPMSGRCHAATFVIDNSGYVVSGFTPNNPPSSHFFRFDHLAGDDVIGQSDRLMGKMGQWISLTPLSSNIVRQQAVGFSLKRASDNKEYGFVGTGWVFNRNTDFPYEYETTRDFWRYDPSKEETDEDAWIQVTTMPQAALPRRGAFAFSLEVNGKMYGYVGGGYTDRPDNQYLRDLWEYDPDGEDGYGSWSQIDTPFERRVGSVVFVIDNRAYICNGANPGLINDFWVFDPEGARLGGVLWTQKRTMNNGHPHENYDGEYRMLGRSFGVAFVVHASGSKPRGHIVGGSQGVAASCWEYNEDNDLWTQRTFFFNNMNRQNREGMVSFTFPKTGRAFVGMGRAGVSAYFDDIWEFIPLINDEVYSDL